ncbi:MAG: hypothetical protein HC862_26515, partial [Scytonema sp. RU_4_4]|nr:hypothetical protein [Scytonema sp. RU_4_4]
MKDLWVPIFVKFRDQSIRLLDVITGLEFLAYDVFLLVYPKDTNQECIQRINALPQKLQRKRKVLLDGYVSECHTLCWLTIKYIFNQSGYLLQREFIHWIRKEISQKFNHHYLSSEKLAQKNLVFINQRSIRQKRPNKNSLLTESDGYKFSWFYNLGNKEVNALALLFTSRKYDFLDNSSNLMSFMK